MNFIVGRKEEQKILARKLVTNRPELIALYGRRRVGKTYLVRNYYKEFIVFEMTGIHEASYADQLKNFSLALGRAINSPAPLAAPDSWIQAFDDLDRFLIDKLSSDKMMEPPLALS